MVVSNCGITVIPYFFFVVVVLENNLLYYPFALLPYFCFVGMGGEGCGDMCYSTTGMSYNNPKYHIVLSICCVAVFPFFFLRVGQYQLP